MTDTSSWYARKMAQMRGVQVAPQQQRGPQMYQPQPPMVPNPRYNDPLYQQPQQVPEVTMDNLYQAMGFWRGGQAHRIDREPCPECGSNQFYSRAQGVRRGPPPAPHCYNCGFNGMFEQGDAATWGAV